jgi:hypothetical protein
MTRVMGGGICDCGDAEAWRPEGFCTRHGGHGAGAGAGAGAAGAWDDGGGLPDALRAAAPAVLGAVLQYCCEVQCKAGPRFAARPAGAWVTVLHNDDVHAFDTVQATLSLAPRRHPPVPAARVPPCPAARPARRPAARGGAGRGCGAAGRGATRRAGACAAGRRLAARRRMSGPRDRRTLAGPASPARFGPVEPAR